MYQKLMEPPFSECLVLLKNRVTLELFIYLFNYTFLVAAFCYLLKKFVVKLSLFKIKLKTRIESFLILELIIFEILTFWLSLKIPKVWSLFWHFLTFWHYEIFWQNNNRIYLIFNSKNKNFCEVTFWHFLTFKCQNLTKMSKCQKMSKCFWELPLSRVMIVEIEDFSNKIDYRTV